MLDGAAALSRESSKGQQDEQLCLRSQRVSATYWRKEEAPNFRAATGSGSHHCEIGTGQPGLTLDSGNAHHCQLYCGHFFSGLLCDVSLLGCGDHAELSACNDCKCRC